MRKFCFMMAMIVVSCSFTPEKVIPDYDALYTITDMKMLKDGRHLLILSSNFNREYDFAQISIFDFEQKKFLNKSIHIPSLAGKMNVTDDEKYVYITTRENNELIKLSLDTKTQIPSLSYAHDTLEKSKTAVKSEPYALVSRDNYLYVTHLRNGELTIFEMNGEKEDIKIDSYRVDSGVTDIATDQSGYFVMTHKITDTLSYFKPLISTNENFSVLIKKSEIFLPDTGFDMRSIEPGINPGTFYVSYRNRDDNGYDYPVIASVTLEETGNLIQINTDFFVPLQGAVAELAVVPYGENNEKELVFVISSTKQKLFIIDPQYQMVIEEMDLNDITLKNGDIVKACDPYQIYSSLDSNGKSTVFVTCFKQDMILVMQPEFEINNEADKLFVFEEVIGE